MITRFSYLHTIKQRYNVVRIVALIGPRQCGKTTIARQFVNPQSPNYFDLESSVDRERLSEPDVALTPLKGLIVIDEVQRIPELFPILRYIHDRDPDKQFLILGSASRQLLRQSSESLAGRISYIEVTPFQAKEVPLLKPLWLRGGFPPSYLAHTEEDSFQWRKDYIRTYLEQDIPSLGFQILPENLRRFWMMLAHYHGQLFNSSELGVSLGISHTTARSYLDILSRTFMVRVLQPWYENLSKRQVKMPKIYFRDSGLFHCLMQLENQDTLLRSPKLGASWEGFALDQVIMSLGVDAEDCYFWSTHNQAELDLLIFKSGKRLGFEFKYQDAPKLTPSLKIAMEDLKLDKITVIYPGQKDYPLDKNIHVRGLEGYVTRLDTGAY